MFLLMRSETTRTSDHARLLTIRPTPRRPPYDRLANQPGGFRPQKLFSIDRVFRNESMDATHLCEFHQVRTHTRTHVGYWVCLFVCGGSQPPFCHPPAPDDERHEQQVEGLVADYDLTLGDLIGTIKTFFERIGAWACMQG